MQLGIAAEWSVKESYGRVLLQDDQDCGHLTATQLNKSLALVLPVDKCLSNSVTE